MPTAIEARREAFRTLVENYENDLSSDDAAAAKHSRAFIKRAIAKGCYEAVTATDPRLTSTSPGAIAIGIAKQIMSNQKAAKAFIDIEIAEGIEGFGYLISFDKSAKNGDEVMPLIATQGDAAVICKPGDKIGEGVLSDLLLVAIDPMPTVVEAALKPYEGALAEAKKRKKKLTGFNPSGHCGGRAYPMTDPSDNGTPSVDGATGGAAGGTSEAVAMANLHRDLTNTLQAHGMGGNKLFASHSEGWGHLHNALLSHGLAIADPVVDHGAHHFGTHDLVRTKDGSRVHGTHLYVARTSGVGDREGTDGSDHPMQGRHEFLAYLTGKRLKESGDAAWSITTKNVHDYKGTADVSPIVGHEPNLWKAFDKGAFDKAGHAAHLADLDMLHSHKNELESPDFKAGKKPDPRTTAASRMRQAIDGGRAPRVPISAVDHGDGGLHIDDGNATAQAAMLAGWKKVPVIVKKPAAEAAPAAPAPTAAEVKEAVTALYTYAYGEKAASILAGLTESKQQEITAKFMKSFGVRPTLKVEADPFAKGFEAAKKVSVRLNESATADTFEEVVDDVAYAMNGAHVAEAALVTVFDNGVTTIPLDALKKLAESIDHRASLLQRTARVILLREGVVPAPLKKSFEHLVAHIRAQVSA